MTPDKHNILTKIINKYGLTEMQAKFCLFYFESDNQTEAAIKAGASEKTARQTASRWLTLVDIINAMDDLRKELATKTILKIEELDQYIYDMATMAKEMVDFTGMNNAADKWGKRLDAYTHTINHKSSDKSMSRLTEEDAAILQRAKHIDND